MFRPYEPKTKNRFVFYINGIESYIIKATNLPTQENSELKVRYLNTGFKVKGLTDWQDIEVTLYDPIDPNGASQVRNWVIQHHLALFGLDGYAFGFNPVPLVNDLGITVPPQLTGVVDFLGNAAAGAAPGGVIDSPLGS